MDTKKRNRRLLGLAMVMMLCTALLSVRLFYIQILCSPELARAALRQRSLGIAWGSSRGDFLDTLGRPVTGATSIWRAVLFPSAAGVRDETVPFLQHVLGMDPGWLEKTLLAGVPVKIPVEIDQRVRTFIQSQPLPGLILAQEPQRYGDPLAVHVVGYLSGGSGVCGLEYLLDAELSGRTGGRLAAVVDAAYRPINGIGIRQQTASPDKAGLNVVLTIDRDLQKRVEEVMSRRNIRGAVVAIDPSNGDVLAMASSPGFNPNNPARFLNDAASPFLNRAVLGYHPGSVFKIVIAAAALEEGIVALNDRFFDPGYIDIGNTRFHCHDKNGHGELTFAEAFACSCNSVFIALGQQLGGQTILEMAERFGFGRVTGAGLREETAGSLPFGRNLSQPDIANMTIGQHGVFVTPLQVALMASAVANGGMLPRPRLVKALVRNNGHVVRQFMAEQPVRIIKPSTALKLTGLMADGVRLGTGRAASGLSGGAAGKTGTAETGRTNESGKTINHAWFAGFAPLENPRICLAVFVEEGDSGALAAAPVFAEILDGFPTVKQ